MNFYASPEYLAVVSRVCFPGRDARIEDVKVGDAVLRLLVIDGTQPVTRVRFLDYHEPLPPTGGDGAVRQGGYAEAVVQGIIEASDWDPVALWRFSPAPFVDWSCFPTYDVYQAYVKQRHKTWYYDQQRLRRRLAERFGAIVFSIDDASDDAFALAIKWKQEQLKSSGAEDYFADDLTLRLLNGLRDAKLLQVSTLRVGGERLVSASIGFDYAGVRSGWILSFDHDPDLRRYSVGNQLVHAMLEESFRLRHREFDFSRGDGAYKWFFATHARLLGPIGHPPLSARVDARINQAKRYARQALERRPQLLRRTVAIATMIRKQQRALLAQTTKTR